MHAFVALMRRYCIDYTNSHDLTLYDEIMEPDYVVHIGGRTLERDTSYASSVAKLFEMAPGLGLVVHELVLNGDRLCMYFSEHGAMPGPDGPALACWRGFGLYKWNGKRLTENFVEQDYGAMQDQLSGGRPHSLIPPHLDPWTTTVPVPPDPRSDAVVREWLAAGELTDAAHVEIDDMREGTAHSPVLDVDRVVVNDLFSAGANVPFHATFQGSVRGGLGPQAERHLGATASLEVAGIARVADGTVSSVQAVTSRMQLLQDLNRRERAG